LRWEDVQLCRGLATVWDEGALQSMSTCRRREYMELDKNSGVEGFSGSRAASDLVLAVGMALTGAGTVMLGVLLPFLPLISTLHDDEAGLLFFLQFLGSSLGAILTGSNRIRSLIVGYALLVVSACCLAFSALHLLFVILFFFGLGLGMVMTSTSLLTSDRYGADRAARLERLNFAWSAGAASAPLLFLPFLHMASPRALFLAFQGLFLLLLAWVVFREQSWMPSAIPMVEDRKPQNAAQRMSLLPLIVLAISAVGVESALSGWLTTYFHRANLQNVRGAALTTSLFWFGITLSRLIFSTRLLALFGRHRVLRTALFGTGASVALLISTGNPILIHFGSALSGMCIGPVYPLVLSFLLERSSRGWVFAVGGIGAVFFPWLTGLLSAHCGSIRFGLIAPCVGVLLMIASESVQSWRRR